jgi:hypothetical protein
LIPVEGQEENGYFNMEATDPITSGSPYLHQGNDGWKFGLIMETASWGLGNENKHQDSWFRFLRYESLPDLTISKNELDFSYAAEGNGTSGEEDRFDIPQQVITVFASPADGEDITISLDNTENFFCIPDDKLTGTGGEIQIWAYPGAPGEYTGNLTVSVKTLNGTFSETVTLKGVSVAKLPVIPSPSIANSERDTWYYIQYPLKTGYYMQSQALDEMLTATPGFDETNPSHLWKFVPVAETDTAFQLINKSGHRLVYNTNEAETGLDENGNPILAPINRFYSSDVSTNTFGFKVRRNDGYYQLQWNEFTVPVTDDEGNPTGETENRITYVFKTTGDNGFTQSSGLTDPGNAVSFVQYGSGLYEKMYDRFDWTIETNIEGPVDGTVGGSDPYYIIDDDMGTAFAFVKAGKSYGGIDAPADYLPSFEIDMQKDLDIDYFLYRHRTGNTLDVLRAKKLSIYGRKDGSDTFEELVLNREIPVAANISEVKIPLETTVSFRYIKVEITEWITTSGSTVQVSDFKAGVFAGGLVGIEPTGETADEQLLIYPNPVKRGDVVNIKTSEESLNVEIKDALGRTIEKTSRAVIKTNSLIPGMYIVTIKTTAGKQLGYTKLLIKN